MLFTDDKLDRLTPIPEPAIKSPAGVFCFEIILDGSVLPATTSRAFLCCDGGTLFQWETDLASVELLLCDNHTERIGEYGIATVPAAFLRVQANAPISKLRFSVQLEHRVPEFQGDVDPGEFYQGLSYFDGSTFVRIGTSDLDPWEGRFGYDLPKRWEKLVSGHTVTSSETWIAVDTPNIERHERCQLGFAVAWKETTSRDEDDDAECGTIFAAENNLPMRDDIKPTPRGWANRPWNK